MENKINYIKDHLINSIKTKEHLINCDKTISSIKEIVEVQVKALENGNKIIFAGNGGSAADAQHLSAEYVSKLKKDREPLAAIALSTDTSALTAIGNDYGYNKLFERQLKAIGNKGDVFIGITTSGNSENIIKAFNTAKDQKITTVGFFGSSNGKCLGLVDYSVNIPSDNTAHIQESHITIGHIICGLVEQEIFFD